MQVCSNQIKVTCIIILPFNLVHLWVFPVSHRNRRKTWVDCLGGGGKGYVGPLSNYWGACPPPPPPPPPPSSYAYVRCVFNAVSYVLVIKRYTVYCRKWLLIDPGNGYNFMGSNSALLFLPPFSMGLSSNGNNLLLTRMYASWVRLYQTSITSGRNTMQSQHSFESTLI